ncbi:MAG TPA: Ig-like domain-containing protein [Gemmatimonadales bacterium]|jgi:uncharacterized protein YjdB
MAKRTLANRILAACGILGYVGAIVVFDLGCPSDSTPSSGSVSSITVQQPAAVRVGGTVPVHATLYDAGNLVLSGKPVTWTSSNPAIATVSGNTDDGSITGVSVGTTTVTASSGGKSGSVQVTVSNVPVATVTVSGAASIALNATTQLTATPKDDAGNVLTGRPVSWSSSDPSVASVNQTGLVTANLVGGPVTISATIEFVTGTAQLSVTGPPIATITVSGTATLPVGVSTTFQAVLKDAGGNVLSGRQVTWSSSNSAIASVDNFGGVTGVAVGGPITITASSEGKSGSASVTITSPVSLLGRVINYVNGAGIAGATVNFRRNDGGLGSLWGSTTTAAGGSFTSPASSTDVSQGVIVEALATGFVTGRILVANVLLGGATFVGDVPLVPTSAQTGGISGTVRNATTGTGLAGATISLFDNIQTAALATQTSDGSGNFSFTNLAAGTYRLNASATGFQTAQRPGVAVGNGGITANQDLVLSPTGTSAVTIVLTWGASPSDLDSHLTGPNADASRFHVYYASRGSLTLAPFANLDVDDVSSFGPETIRITQMNSGTYRYSVHDFSNRSSTTSSALGSSGAKVQVYTATGLAQTFFVPSQPGTLWTVFEMSGTLASPLILGRNVMSFASDPAAITSPPVGSGAATSDAGLIARAAAEHPKPNPR